MRLHKELVHLKTSTSEKDLGSETDRKAKAASLKRCVFPPFTASIVYLHSSARAATLHQFTIDVFDLWIPASGLGLVNVNDGVLGIFGFVVSSSHLTSLTRPSQFYYLHFGRSETLGRACGKEVMVYYTVS